MMESILTVLRSIIATLKVDRLGRLAHQARRVLSGLRVQTAHKARRAFRAFKDRKAMLVHRVSRESRDRLATMAHRVSKEYKAFKVILAHRDRLATYHLHGLSAVFSLRSQPPTRRRS